MAAVKPTPVQPPLSNSSINLLAVREHARKELVSLLNAMPGKKALVLDPKLVGPLGLIVEMPVLKELGVDKIYQLLPEPLVTDCKNVFYLVRPNPEYMDMIATQILEHGRVSANPPPVTSKDPAVIAAAAAAAAPKNYAVHFVPRRTLLCEKVLEDRGVLGDIDTLGELHMDWIPLDDDVISMEMDSAFREVYVDGDPSALYYVAKAVMKLQHMFGLIPRLTGKGDAAHQVVRLLMRMRREAGEEAFAAAGVLPEIDTLVLFDRASDLTTPLLSQGLLDELFEIKNNTVSVDADVFAAGSKTAPGADKAAATSAGTAAGNKRKLSLNSADILFSEIRDLNFSVLGPHLHMRASQVRETYEERHKAQTVSEMAEFVKKFKHSQQEHSLLHVHINLAEKVAEEMRSVSMRQRLEAEQAMLKGAVTDDMDPEKYVEECIAKREPLHRALRLLCLLSVTRGGLPAKKLDYFKHEILQTYGFEYLFTLQNLERLGALRREQRVAAWPMLRKQLRLVDMNNEVDMKSLEDIAGPYGGYAPPLVRLLELSGRPGWKAIEESLGLLRGATFEYRQDLPNAVEDRAKLVASLTEKKDGEKEAGQKTPVVLCVFIGGCTYGEISAIRQLARKEKNRREFVIATTKIINGRTLLDGCVELIENNLDRASLTQK